MTEIEIAVPKVADIDDGSYVATLEKVVQEKGDFGPFFRWSWLVETKDEQGETEIVPFDVLTSGKTGPQTKAYSILAALNGGKGPKAGTTVEPPTGKRVVLRINHLKYNGEETPYPQMAEVTPYVDPQSTLDELPR